MDESGGAREWGSTDGESVEVEVVAVVKVREQVLEVEKASLVAGD